MTVEGRSVDVLHDNLLDLLGENLDELDLSEVVSRTINEGWLTLDSKPHGCIVGSNEVNNSFQILLGFSSQFILLHVHFSSS